MGPNVLFRLTYDGGSDLQDHDVEVENAQAQVQSHDALLDHDVFCDGRDGRDVHDDLVQVVLHDAHDDVQGRDGLHGGLRDLYGRLGRDDVLQNP